MDYVRLTHACSWARSQVKKYRVLCWKTKYGYYEIEAESQEESSRIGDEKLEEGDDMDSVRDTDTGIAGVEEIN